MDVDNILHNLKILAMLREQDKLVTGPRFALRQPSTARGLFRWWYGEHRQDNIDHVRTLFAAAVNLVIVASDANHQHTFASLDVVHLIGAIRQALDGVAVLLRTYHDDHDISVQLENMSHDVRFRMREFTRAEASSTPGVRLRPPGAK